MRVELGGAEIGVSEHLLDAPQVGAALEQMRGEGVPEQMGVDLRGVEPGLGCEAAKDEERARARERTPLGVQEELRPVTPVEVGAAAGEVAAEGLSSLRPQGDDSLLVPLPDAADEPALEVDAAPLEPDRLGDAQPGAVEELDEGAVAQRARRDPVGRVDQALDFGERKRPRKARAAARQVDVGGRVVGPEAERDEMAVEGAGGRGAGGGGGPRPGPPPPGGPPP